MEEKEAQIQEETQKLIDELAKNKVDILDDLDPQKETYQNIQEELADKSNKWENFSRMMR